MTVGFLKSQMPNTYTYGIDQRSTFGYLNNSWASCFAKFKTTPKPTKKREKNLKTIMTPLCSQEFERNTCFPNIFVKIVIMYCLYTHFLSIML